MSLKIAEMLDKWLVEKRVEDKKERKSGVISPSSLGQCYRRQYWTRKGEPESNPIEAQTLRVFEAGKKVHDVIQSMFPKECCEVEVKIGDDVYGHADIVLEDEVIDIKSVGVFQFKKFAKMSQEQFEEEKVDYVLQVCTYAYGLGKKKARMALVCKDTWEIHEGFEFDLKHWESRVVRELDVLRNYWEIGELPEAKPRLYNGREGEYCSFREKCWAMEGKKCTECKSVDKTFIY